MQNLLRAEGLTKRFADVVANDAITFDVRKGEIHCLFGENGAGKSTLSSCLYGYYRPDSGTLHFKGQPVHLASPRDAIRLGIGMVHQHFVLVPDFTVLENIIVGSDQPGIVLKTGAARRKIADLCGAYGIDLNLDREVWQLSVGQQQWVEILKALYFDVELLILDEPTAVLTPQQSEQLFQIIRQMRQRGISIVLISHKLKEVMKSDRVTILRKGRAVATVETAATSPEELTRLMVGHKVPKPARRGQKTPGGAILQVDRVCALGDWNDPVLEEISFEVASSEILGLAGVAGNGQKELFEVLTGVRPITSGEILLDGTSLSKASARRMMDCGVGFIPDDRFREGLVPDFGTAENLVLGWQRAAAYRLGPLLSRKAIDDLAARKIEEFGIVTSSSAAPVKRMSGGNAQRVILARELQHARRLLLANQPARGLDVVATEFVYERLLERRDAGFGIILASEELDDLMRLCDRIAVIFKGRIMGIVRPEETTLLELGLMMVGTASARYEACA